MKGLIQRADGSLGLVGRGALVAYSGTFSAGVEAADNIDVLFQLCDGLGNPLKLAGVFVGFNNVVTTADNFTLDAINSLAVQGGIGYLVLAGTTTNLAAATDVNGKVNVRLNKTGAGSHCLAAAIGFGASQQFKSATLTWA
jgi:hypothetical protein